MKTVKLTVTVAIPNNHIFSSPEILLNNCYSPYGIAEVKDVTFVE